MHYSDGLAVVKEAGSTAGSKMAGHRWKKRETPVLVLKLESFSYREELDCNTNGADLREEAAILNK